MDNILFIDATVRSESRTRELAEYLIAKLTGSVSHLKLKDCSIKPLDEQFLNYRMECCAAHNFSDPYFDYAKQFAAADCIVIAAPLWDGSFPAVLKKYIETISITGVTFEYTDDGFPRGLCKAKALYYITTSGGKIYNEEYGYGYINNLAVNMFGIGSVQLFKAEQLDVLGTDTRAIMNNSKRLIDQSFADV